MPSVSSNAGRSLRATSAATCFDIELVPRISDRAYFTLRRAKISEGCKIISIFLRSESLLPPVSEENVKHSAPKGWAQRDM